MTGVVWALQPVVPVSALAGLYVLAVLPVAVLWGVWPALIVSVVSAVAFDFFLTESWGPKRSPSGLITLRWASVAARR